MKRIQVGAAGMLGLLLGACGDAGVDTEEPKPISANSIKEEESALGLGAAGAGRIEKPRLGPDQRRVTVIVLPGNATVEVDGQPAQRRNGVIELTGKVGEIRKLRVSSSILSASKGARTDERKVVIGENGASPPLIDLNEALQQGPAGEPEKKFSFKFED